MSASNTPSAYRAAFRRAAIFLLAVAAGAALGGCSMVGSGLQGIGSGFNKAGGAVSRLM